MEKSLKVASLLPQVPLTISNKAKKSYAMWLGYSNKVISAAKKVLNRGLKSEALWILQN